MPNEKTKGVDDVSVCPDGVHDRDPNSLRSDHLRGYREYRWHFQKFR